MSDPKLAPRSPRDSITEMTEVVMPQHANAMGAAFGGTAMGWIDICAAVVARRHCAHVAVTDQQQHAKDKGKCFDQL